MSNFKYKLFSIDLQQEYLKKYLCKGYLTCACK